MFIKRFYVKLLDDYFREAVFAKPTGDGLLLIFRYDERNLHEVSNYVLSTCFKILDDFPAMFRDDPMINFPTPSHVGFGISRGPSCCLFSGRSILDYSGQLLNLAARLNDLARPEGIVIAGSYLLDVIPEHLREQFRMEEVFIRGIAEEKAISVFCSKPHVALPAYSLHPIKDDNWQLITKNMSVKELNKLAGTFTIDIPSAPASVDKTRMEIKWDNPKLKGYWRSQNYSYYKCHKDSSGHHVTFELSPAKTLITEEKLKGTANLSFLFEYVPKITSRELNKESASNKAIETDAD
jgi:hypothetical protein